MPESSTVVLPASHEAGVSADRPIVYPELPPDLQKRLSWRSLKYFGAGAIIASVTIGSGETVFAARGGAVFGYALLWCFVGGGLLKGFQVYVAARHMTLTGEHPLTHWAAMPGPRNWVPWTIGIISFLCFPFWHAGLPLALGTTINWIFGIEGSSQETLFYARVFGTINLVLIVVLTWLQSYEVLEKVQAVIIGILLCTILAAVFAARPEWLGVLSGVLVPRIPDYEPWVKEAYVSIAQRPPWVEIVTYLGAIGGGTYDYIGYIGCLREKRWGALGLKRDKFEVRVHERPVVVGIDLGPDNLLRARRWLRPAKIDTGAAFASVIVFAACFAILGAVILHPARVVPEGQDLLSHQASFLTQISPSLLFVYQIGIFFAFWGTIYGAYEIYIRTAFECFAPASRKVRNMPYRRFRMGILLWSAVGGLILMWTMDDPVAIVTPAAILGGVFACGLWCLFMLWTDRKFLPEPLRMGPWLVTAVGASGLILTVLGLKAIWDYVAAF